MKSLTVVIDTREQVNHHIVEYLAKKDIPMKIQKLNYGDYSWMIPMNEDLGITRDIYSKSAVERKAHMDEITGNLQKDTRSAFQNELIRAAGNPFTLLVEDNEAYMKMLKGDYRSNYNPLALLGTLNTFKARYGFEIVYIDKMLSGNWLYYHFYYQAKEYLKNGYF